MKLDRRATAVLGIVALVAVPAAVLRVLCVGRSCDQERRAERNVPFCSLPSDTRAALAAGFRDGRSPDVLGVTRAGVGIVSRKSGLWPAIEREAADVPVVLWGRGVRAGADLSGMSLEDLAPTVADLIQFQVPHPEVRSGRPVGRVTSAERPALVLLIVVREALDAGSDPVLDALSRGGASGNARPTSLPYDPAAVMTTIGTGGLPTEHGITGGRLRNEHGEVAAAWMGGAPISVIATLADDLDDATKQRAKIGLVADTTQARGLVGGNWYVDRDRDSISIVATPRVIPALRDLLGAGFGDDEVTDIVGVSLATDEVAGVTPALHALRAAEKIVGPDVAAAIVVLPRVESPPLRLPAASLIRQLARELGSDVVEADTSGGLFLDQDALAAAGVTKDDVVTVLRGFEYAGERVFADVFPGLAVAFARFC